MLIGNIKVKIKKKLYNLIIGFATYIQKLKAPTTTRFNHGSCTTKLGGMKRRITAWKGIKCQF
jgi:hypothetical protein